MARRMSRRGSRRGSRRMRSMMSMGGYSNNGNALARFFGGRRRSRKMRGGFFAIPGATLYNRQDGTPIN